MRVLCVNELTAHEGSGRFGEEEGGYFGTISGMLRRPGREGAGEQGRERGDRFGRGPRASSSEGMRGTQPGLLTSLMGNGRMTPEPRRQGGSLHGNRGYTAAHTGSRVAACACEQAWKRHLCSQSSTVRYSVSNKLLQSTYSLLLDSYVMC